MACPVVKRSNAVHGHIVGLPFKGFIPTLVYQVFWQGYDCWSVPEVLYIPDKLEPTLDAASASRRIVVEHKQGAFHSEATGLQRT